eukprot:1444035-Alexandrium_andersonii.AAC.1
MRKKPRRPPPKPCDRRLWRDAGSSHNSHKGSKEPQRATGGHRVRQEPPPLERKEAFEATG